MESAAVIVIVITINAILGTIQTVKAEQSLQSLKKLSGPEAKVLRDGTTVQLPARELVVGDIILLEAGDMIPADGRLIENASLKVDESALTGESLAVEKNLETLSAEVPLGDRTNMVFSGSFVTRQSSYNRHRNADGSRENCRAFEIDLRKTDSVAGESGGIWQEAFHFDSDILRNPVCNQCISRGKDR